MPSALETRLRARRHTTYTTATENKPKKGGSRGGRRVKPESEEEDEIAALWTVESERRDGDEEMYIARTSR